MTVVRLLLGRLISYLCNTTIINLRKDVLLIVYIVISALKYFKCAALTAFNLIFVDRLELYIII